MNKKETLSNFPYILLTVVIIVGFFIAFTKIVNLLGREIISWLLIIFVYIGFIKVRKDDEGKWSFLGIIKAVGAATVFIAIASFIIWYMRNSGCDFDIFNRFCI